MRQYETVELTFSGKEPQGSQAVVDVNAVFTKDGATDSVAVKGFYAGSGEYKVRFLPMEQGNYHYQVDGEVQAKGSISVAPAAGGHGIIKACNTHFEYGDGSLFLPFGTTVYAFFHQSEELIDQTFSTLAKAPFNKVRLCLFPKHYDYNHNEPQLYAFEKDAEGKWDVHRPCFAFWEHFERRLKQLEEMDIQVDLILFHPYDRWGFSSLSGEDNLVYLDYLLRRFSALPNLWWSLANEYDLCGAKTMEDWYEIEGFVAENDPYHHLLSNHNCFQPWDFSRERITHVSIQSKALERAGVWMAQYGKPVVIDECCYEGNIIHTWGNISGREMVSRFWKAYAQGGYCTHGETFLDPENEILWWARGGELKGESPERIAFLRNIMESLPGPLTPVQGHFDKLAGLTEKDMEAMEASVPEDQLTFARAVLRTDRAYLQMMADKDREFKGSCLGKAFLKYYGMICCAVDEWELPMEESYRIEVIDTWEMTRKTVMTGVNGKVSISLPGKEGMAVLAVAE